MEKSQYMTFGWIAGFAISFILWELGLRFSNKAWQALAGVIVGSVCGYVYIRLKKNDGQ